MDALSAVDAMRNFTAILALALVVVGCVEQADSMQPVSPEASKVAVITLIRERPGEFVGNPDPEILEELTLTDLGDGSWGFSVFTIWPAERRYSALVDVGPAEFYSYEGKLKTIGDRVVAARPSVTRYSAAFEDPEF